jgi:hypothetical protein
MIKISIDVTKISKDRLYIGKTREDGTSAKYLSITLVENKEGKDRFGNDGFVAEDVSKEERLSGVKGVIIGNWKKLEFGERKPVERAADPAPAPSESNLAEDDIPF